MVKGKKAFSILLVVLVLVLSFAGCSKKEPKETITGPKTEAKEEGFKTETKSHEIEDGLGWKQDTSKADIQWYINFSWFPRRWGDDITSQMITEKTGINIEYIVPAGNEAEKLNSMIASNTLPDLVTLGWWEPQVKQMIESGLVYSLTELADQYDPYFYEVADEAKLGWYREDDGQSYAYPNSSYSPSDYDKYPVMSNQTFLVKKDIYEAIGSPDMRTPEGFVAALKKAKEKFPMVNGQPLIPLGTTEFSDIGSDSFKGYLQNHLAIPFEKDGKIYDRDTDPDYIMWLKTFRQANEDGLIAKDIFIDKRAQMEEKVAQGRYFAMMVQNWDYQGQQKSLYQQDPNSVYIAVPGPANTNLDNPTLAGQGIAGWTVTLISKNTKNPERAIKFLSYMISEEGQHDIYFGKEGVMWETVNGKDTYLPDIYELKQKDNDAFEKQYGGMSTHWMFQDNAMFSKWEPPLEEPLKQPQEWTKPYVTYFGQYDDADPIPTSEEGIGVTKINNKWGQVLPQLILAKTEAEFDEVFKDYIAYRDQQGWDKIQQFRQNKYKINKEKLGLK